MPGMNPVKAKVLLRKTLGGVPDAVLAVRVPDPGNAYLFLKPSSFRFSTNAFMASFWSSVPKQVAKARAS